ncbi:hypothetical protein RSOLAG1IB_11010 [Rhizoctonia solani AG-1 IB]|uniref:Uncharacterized protein n=1 Tax=Thanatephorus cucumeris (strain AG1-IB / isolate 7/3/14) TaxID=1108050 RepID=A0A0B7G1G0_THACB|nr:hypothetical protein RSOLAG1IB_11010 [Rhizoctonia solani AG-1 IB]
MDRVRLPTWSVSPPNTPNRTANIGLTNILQRAESAGLIQPIQPPAPPSFTQDQAQIFAPLARPVPTHNPNAQLQPVCKRKSSHFHDADSESDLPEPSQICTEDRNKAQAEPIVLARATVNREIGPDQGHRPWSNNDIEMVIMGVTDPDHPENFQLSRVKGFGAHVEAQWVQFSQKYLNGRRSGRAIWTKFKEIKETYCEVRNLHKETGNGGLLQIEDNDSKPEILKKLGTRLQTFESRAGKLKHVTSKEVYYTWVKGGPDSWFARMHARYCDDMTIERPIERHSGRLSPLSRADTPDSEDVPETDKASKSALSAASDAPSTPSRREPQPKKGGKRKAAARSSELDDTDSAPSKSNKVLERLLDAIPAPVPPSIHERRIALDEKRLEMEDKRAEKNNSAADKRIQLEMQQFEEDRERRKRRWEAENEDRKRRRLIEDEDRERRRAEDARRWAIEDEDRQRRRLESSATQSFAQRQAQIKFFLEMASTADEEMAQVFRQHAKELAAAMAKETFANASATDGSNLKPPNVVVPMQDPTQQE